MNESILTLNVKTHFETSRNKQKLKSVTYCRKMEFIKEESEATSYPEASRMNNEDSKDNRGLCTCLILH